MPGINRPMDDEVIIADLMRAQRRRLRAGVTQIPQPAKDRFTVAASPASTYTLSAIPYRLAAGSSLNLSLNGAELVEGVDYTVDYTTAIVTVTATLKGTPTPADVLTADYWTTGDLIAASGPVDDGLVSPTFVGSSLNSGNGTNASCTVPPGYQAGDRMLLAIEQLNTDTNLTTPAGWTLVATPTSNANLAVFTRVATASESTVTVVRPATGGDWNAQMRIYRGSTITPPVSAYGVTFSATTSCTTTPVSYTGPAAVVTFWAFTANFSAGVLTPDAALSNLLSRTETTGALASGDEQVTLAGATSARTCTASGSGTVNGWFAGTVVLGRS